ncbi:MAG: TIM barrel protein [bacterium]|nr:TIM barrel protein [bacterium]
MEHRISRRTALRNVVAGGAVAAAATSLSITPATAQAAPLKGRIKQSVCRWCYGKIPLEELCQAAKQMGLLSIELMGENDWPTLKKHGLTCAMANAKGISIGKGFNRVENHDRLIAIYEDLIPKAADAGLPNVICMSGNREGLDDEEGIEICAKGLKRIMGLAEAKKVNVVMELLNSKVNHKDYQCDHTAWGAELCRRVGSERMKLLYDVYHMQIMEGDIIRTIRENIQYIGHFHTGGNPGRNEIDETQEIYYPAVMKAIAETDFDGYVGQEFIPKGPDPLKSLRKAVQICDV